MKLFELNFTLLRKFKELEGLFDLFNQMIVTNGNHCTVSVKSAKDVYFLEITLYASAEVPLITITRDLQTFPVKKDNSYTSTVDGKDMFFKFSIKEEKYVKIEVFNLVYEYTSKNSFMNNIEVIENKDFEELFTFNLKVKKSLSNISLLINILNSMLSNNCYSFVALRNKVYQCKETSNKKNIILSLFSNNMSRPSVVFNVSLFEENNFSKLPKYNMLCSQPENDIKVYITFEKDDKHHNHILKVHVCLPKTSKYYDKIKEQCELIDYSIATN